MRVRFSQKRKLTRGKKVSVIFIDESPTISGVFLRKKDDSIELENGEYPLTSIKQVVVFREN